MHVVPKCMPWRFGASYSLGSVPLVMRVSKALFSLMTINIKMETALVKQGPTLCKYLEWTLLQRQKKPYGG